VLDARTWLLWALTTLVAASSARNPLYALLLIAVTRIVHTLCAPMVGHKPLTPLRLIILVVPLTALFNLLTIRLGDTILFRLPAWLPLLGGPVTLEALAYGLMNGLVLAAILSSFAALNQIVPVRDLVQIAPRAFHEAGVVLSIALTFIPQTMTSLTRIREAQEVRGHRVRSLRDWLPIVVPLLVSGLERSMELAEAMVARGYGAISQRAHPWRLQVLVALGLLLLLGGWGLWLFIPVRASAISPAWIEPLQGAALALMGVGAVCVMATIWLAGRGVKHTSYRPRHWTWGDSLALAGCALTAGLLLLPLPWVDRGTLAYNPYPRLSWPRFDPLLGLGLLGLLVPALVGKPSHDSVQSSDLRIS
jgi:energy-coupling factor transport system permease protein